MFFGEKYVSVLVHCRPQDGTQDQIQIKKNLIFAAKMRFLQKLKKLCKVRGLRKIYLFCSPVSPSLKKET